MAVGEYMSVHSHADTSFGGAPEPGSFTLLATGGWIALADASSSNQNVDLREVIVRPAILHPW